MAAYIKAISYYLPKQILTNSQLAEMFPEWTAEKIATKVGISERHIADNDETATDMAYAAAQKMFNEHCINKSDIDFVLLCTQSPDYFLPSSACILQSRLGLSTKCGAFDFNLGCSGYEYGLTIAKGLIETNVAKNILFLTAETYTKYLHPSDKGNRTIFSDAATATLISTSGFAKIGESVLGTDGRGANMLVVKNGAARQPNKQNTLEDHLFMDGAVIFDFSADVVPQLVEDTLSKNKLVQNDINLFVFHQANKYMINYLRKLLEIEKERFYICMEHVGNTVSSTIPIALYEAQKEGKLNGNVLLAGFGVGLSWGGTVLSIA